MSSEDIIKKLEQANLLGRGGAGFPTHIKWQMLADQKSDKTYIVANGSEGELHVHKDKYILEKHPTELIAGIKVALNTFENSEAYIYLRHDYFKRFRGKLKRKTRKLPITVFKEPGFYIAGEETAVCDGIEGKRPEPRLKPPYPGENGIHGKPTLINNVETFYYIGQIAAGTYQNMRLYTISGDVANPGVYEFPIDWTMEKVLKETNNYPEALFYVQVGGGSSGDILLPDEIKQPVSGSGSIIVFDKTKTDPFELMKTWIDFFQTGNCDKCVPCREGIIRLTEMIESKKIDQETLEDLFFVLEQTSFCALGKSIPTPIRSLLTKVVNE